jgi:hypothetical protein
MFEIIGYEEFRSKYLARRDCAGINWASDLAHGNIVFIKGKGIDGPLPRRISIVSQILYFKILGMDFIVQDEDFYSFYK